MRADAPNHISSSGTQRRAKRDYWDMEREKLVTGLLARIASRGEYVALRELLAMDLPEVLNVVLRNHARHVVRNEKPLALQTHRRFELEDQEIRRQFRGLRDGLAERIVFESIELKPALNFGVRLQFDLIVRPRVFLENLLFQHAATRERDDVLVILMGFHDARDFVAMCIDRINAYAFPAISKENFIDLVRQVEREVYGKNPVATVMADVRAYQNYCRQILGLGAPSEIMDNQVILAMLNERRLTDLSESLLPEFAKKESWLLEEIEALLQECVARAGGGTAPTPQGVSEIDLSNFLEEAASEIENQLVQTSLRELRSTQTIANPPQIVSETTPLSAQASLPLAEEKREEMPSAPVKKRPLIRFEEEEPVMVSRAKLEQQPSGPFPALEKLIDDKSRKLFVKSIFQRDEEAYSDFVQRLELIQTWKEAKALFDGELNRRKINPYTKEAIRFSDVIFGRYFAKRG